MMRALLSAMAALSVAAISLPSLVYAYPVPGAEAPVPKLEPVIAPAMPAVLQPVTSWVVEGANHRCRASRDIGDAAKPITLEFKVHLFSGLQGLIVEPAIARVFNSFQENVFEPGRADFGHRQVAPTIMRIAPMSERRQVVEFRLSHDEFAMLRKSGELWTYSLHHNRRFNLRSINDVSKLLDSCEEGLAAEFGLPVEEQRKLAILPAENSKKRIFTTDDYPEAAIRKAIGAPTYGVVSIDASGKPTGCYIVEPSGSPEIDAKSCSVYLQRGHFKPARDLGGNAVRGLYPFHINWVVGW